MDNTNILYGARYPDGKYAGLDIASGGYIYPTNSVMSAHTYPEVKRKDAEQWIESWNKPNSITTYGGPLTLVKITVITVDA